MFSHDVDDLIWSKTVLLFSHSASKTYCQWSPPLRHLRRQSTQLWQSVSGCRCYRRRCCRWTTSECRRWTATSRCSGAERKERETACGECKIERRQPHRWRRWRRQRLDQRPAATALKRRLSGSTRLHVHTRWYFHTSSCCTSHLQPDLQRNYDWPIFIKYTQRNVTWDNVVKTLIILYRVALKSKPLSRVIIKSY